MSDLISERMMNPVGQMPEFFEMVSVPEGKLGDVVVKRMTIPANDPGVMMTNLRSVRDGHEKRLLVPGDYTRLSVGEERCMMSDTYAEAWENEWPVQAIRKLGGGNVLVNGLGIGFVAQAILRVPGVKRLVIIEKNPNVIALVGPTITDPRATIIEGDAFEWWPRRRMWASIGNRWDVVWHDIWPDICADNLKQMNDLYKRYRWEGCWSQEYLTSRDYAREDVEEEFARSIKDAIAQGNLSL